MDWRSNTEQKVRFLLERNYAAVVERWNSSRLSGAIPATAEQAANPRPLTEKEKETERLARRHQTDLQGMDPEEIDELYATEYAVYQTEREAAAITEKARRDAYERADFDYVAKLPLWTIKEAISFLFGKDPVKWEFMEDPAAKKMERLVLDAIGTGQLSTIRVGGSGIRVIPIEFVRWAELNEIDVPEELAFGVQLWYRKREESIGSYDRDTETNYESTPVEPGSSDSSRSSSAQEQTDEPPQWLLQPSAGNKWRCGPEDKPILIDGTRGLIDLRHAIQRSGADCDPLELYASSDDEMEAAAALKISSSPDALDYITRTEVQSALDDLEAEKEAAHENGDIERFQYIEEQLDTYQRYLKGSTRPGGRPRKLTAGDSHGNAIKAMRGRKSTVLKNLRNAGLNDMADDIQDNYVLRTRSFSYLGSSLNVG